MRKLTILVFLALSGCAAQFAANDDAKCTSYGAAAGTPAYAQCRAQLDAARTQSTATAIAGMNAVSPPRLPDREPIHAAPPSVPRWGQ